MESWPKACAAILPPELLGIIFEHFVVDQAALHLPPSTFLGARTLSSVCSSWRQAAIGNPSLWKRIHISLLMKPAVLEHFCSTVFSRVKGYPCAIHIRDIKFIGRKTEDEHPIHLCKIHPDMNVTQLQLSFLVEGEYDDPEIVKFVETVDGRVHCLFIDAGSVTDSYITGRPWNLAKVLSPLVHLRKLDIWYADSTIDICAITWPLVEELELKNLEGTLALADLLAMFPNLRRLGFIQDGKRYWEVDDKRYRPCSHSNLREMHLQSIDMVGWSSIGDGAARGIFPSLARLEVEEETDLEVFLVESAHRNIRYLVVNGDIYEPAEAYLARIF